MQLQINGITVLVSDDEIGQIVRQRLAARRSPDEALNYLRYRNDVPIETVPRIGELWTAQGGVYAGIARGRDGAPDYYLIVGPEYDGDVDWNAAMAWARGLSQHGYTDYSLPTRKEQALCFANVSELFQERAYWSDTQHASDSSHAWLQLFIYGGQHYWSKDDELRARAVRRLAIQ